MTGKRFSQEKLDMAKNIVESILKAQKLDYDKLSMTSVVYGYLIERGKK